MPVAVCATCKKSEKFLAYKKKDAHEHCRTANEIYEKKQQVKEALKEKGVICSAIGAHDDDTVVVYTTLGLYYRIITTGAYDYTQNATEAGTIEGMRARGIVIHNATREDFDTAHLPRALTVQ